MHSVALRREREPSRTSTSMGQARRQAPQPTHLSWSQVTRMRLTWAAGFMSRPTGQTYLQKARLSRSSAASAIPTA